MVMFPEMRVDGITNGSETREEAFTSIWHHCGGRDVMALTLMRPDKLDTLYALWE